MSWHFSRALVAAYSAESSVGSDVSAPSSLTPTAAPSLHPDKTTARSRPSRSGITSAPFLAMSGAELLTWFLAGFHVRISPSRAEAQELTAQSQDSGEKWQGSLAKYSPDASSWKTHQRSLFADSEPCSVIWPRWGLMRGGVCWEQTPLARRTAGSGCGLSLPTLTVCGNYNRKGASKTSGDGLVTALKKMPTLTAHDSRDCGTSPSQVARNHKTLPMVIGGPLSPMWGEWFMGWPLEWTELKPLETGKFQQWLSSHGTRSGHSST